MLSYAGALAQAASSTRPSMTMLGLSMRVPAIIGAESSVTVGALAGTEAAVSSSATAADSSTGVVVGGAGAPTRCPVGALAGGVGGGAAGSAGGGAGSARGGVRGEVSATACRVDWGAALENQASWPRVLARSIKRLASGSGNQSETTRWKGVPSISVTTTRSWTPKSDPMASASRAAAPGLR